MKWFDKWFVRKCQWAWENRDLADEVKLNKLGAAIQMPTAMIERGQVEGENRISFELSSAVGGKILNVRHYDPRKDRHDIQTYVIPTGEDIGERVAKIINLEMFRQ